MKRNKGKVLRLKVLKRLGKIQDKFVAGIKNVAPLVEIVAPKFRRSFRIFAKTAEGLAAIEAMLGGAPKTKEQPAKTAKKVGRPKGGAKE